MEQGGVRLPGLLLQQGERQSGVRSNYIAQSPPFIASARERGPFWRENRLTAAKLPTLSLSLSAAIFHVLVRVVTCLASVH